MSSDAFEGQWATCCVRLARQVSEALEHAHARGVVHRDVKPSNLMVTATGRVMLLDFGIAHDDDAEAMTRTDQQPGSLPYMAPEQLDETIGPVGPRTDVYALGVTLYEMLTLGRPYRGESGDATRRLILDGRPASPR